MANMSVNQRNQFDRVDLSVPTTGVGVRNHRLVAAFTFLAAALVVVLGYAAAVAMDGWSQVVVFAFIILNVIGAIIAVNPARRA